MSYVEPTFRPDELVGPRECAARAQRALEEAELNLGRIVIETGGQLDLDDALRFAEINAAIGRGWAELGAALRGGAR